MQNVQLSLIRVLKDFILFIYLALVVVVWVGGSCIAWCTFALLFGFLPMNNCPLKQLGLGKISRVLSLA